jgi:Isochorismatase family
MCRGAIYREAHEGCRVGIAHRDRRGLRPWRAMSTLWEINEGQPVSLRIARFAPLAVLMGLTMPARGGDEPLTSTRVYENRLKPIANPEARPILADYPQFVEPVREVARFEAPTLGNDPGADLEVRAWRFSYNARGIIEIPNRLRADRTAIIVVHPWGIDDGQGWRTPEPAGVAFQCTPAKNRIVLDHAATVIDPFLKAMRSKVALVAYSLPGREDPIRKKLYRSLRGQPTDRRELKAKLESFNYRAQALPSAITVSAGTPTIDYFRQFPGLDAGAAYDGPGFWDLPIPVMKSIDVAPRDVVIYDGEGYPALRDFLRRGGIRHVLLAGYNADMCVCSTTAGYKNLSQDFDVFLVGDATIATFPAHPTPRFATTSAVCFASLNLFITQVSWVRSVPDIVGH